MAVTRDAHGTTLDVNAGATPQSYTGLTIGAHSNLALVVEINFSAAAPAGLALTWDSGATNQAMSLIKSAAASSNYTAQLWGLVNPATGNKTLSIAWTSGTASFVAAATSYFNVDQTGGVTTFYGTGSATGTTPVSLILTSATGDMTVTAMAGNTGTGTVNQTLLYFLSGAGAENGGASEAVGGASVTHTWTVDPAVPVVVSGSSIKQAGGVTHGIKRNTNLDGLSASGPFFADPLALMAA